MDRHLSILYDLMSLGRLQLWYNTFCRLKTRLIFTSDHKLATRNSQLSTTRSCASNDCIYTDSRPSSPRPNCSSERVSRPSSARTDRAKATLPTPSDGCWASN